MVGGAVAAVAGKDPLRVVFLAFEFPPYVAGGVYRAAKLAKFLPSCGIDLDVVTARADQYATWGAPRLDPALERDIPRSVRVHRAPIGMPLWYRRWLENPLGHYVLQWAHWGDPLSRLWRRPLFDLLDKLIAERRPDVLLATAPPFGVAVLARLAAKRYGLPLVIDWRDPWTRWASVPYPSYAHYRYVRHQELACLLAANVSVCTSHVTRADWIAEFPEVSPARLLTIYNGFDPDDMAAAAAGAERADRARIVYVGSFYYDPVVRDAVLRPAWRRLPHRWMHYRKRREDWLYRSPYFFLRGLRRAADRDPTLHEKLEVVFAGVVPPWLPSMLAETGTTEFVTLRGPISHEASLALQAGASALLLTSAKVDGGRDYSIAGKTYEYIGLRRPILGVVADGAMRDVIEWTGTGMVANPDDTDAVADAIARIGRGEDIAVRSSSMNPRFIAMLDRRYVASALAAALRSAADEGFLG